MSSGPSVILGMTGYGRADLSLARARVTVDVRTVNHRFLDVEVRGTALPAALEARLRKQVASRLARGRVEVIVVVELVDASAGGFRVDRSLMKALADAAQQTATDLAIPGRLTLDHLVALPWGRAVDAAAPRLDSAQEEGVCAALESALEAVVAVRAREGSELSQDLGARVRAIESALARVREDVAGAAAAHVARLRQRMAELVAGHAVDEARLAQEAALLADKADVTEEIVRLAGHLDHLKAILDGPGPTGKRLEFTLQEALREVNTMGAKARGLQCAAAVIDMKCELERMREQAANLE